MVKPKILNEEPISMFDVKVELEKIKKRDKELNFRANKTEEYLNQTLNLSTSKSKELKQKIEKLKIPRLKDQFICKIVDLMPGTVKELKVVMQGYAVTVNNENLKKIADAVAGFIPKK